MPEMEQNQMSIIIGQALSKLLDLQMQSATQNLQQKGVALNAICFLACETLIQQSDGDEAAINKNLELFKGCLDRNILAMRLTRGTA